MHKTEHISVVRQRTKESEYALKVLKPATALITTALTTTAIISANAGMNHRVANGVLPVNEMRIFAMTAATSGPNIRPNRIRFRRFIIYPVTEMLMWP